MLELEECRKKYCLLGGERELEWSGILLLEGRLLLELSEQELDFCAGHRPDLVAITTDREGLPHHGSLDTNPPRILDFGSKRRPLDHLWQASRHLIDGGFQRQGPIACLVATQEDTCHRCDHLGEDVVAVLRGGGSGWDQCVCLGR